MQRIVDFCREREMIAVHDFAYADIGFDGYMPPSILQAEGAKECAVELYSMTKGFSMAGWRIAFLVRQQRGRAGAREAQELPRLRHLPADPDRRHRDDERESGATPSRCARPTSRGATRSATGSRASAGTCRARAGRCSCGRRSPRPYAELGSLGFASALIRDCEVAVSPGNGFGPGGEGFVRFALIENEQRIGQAVRSLRRGLDRLQPAARV